MTIDNTLTRTTRQQQLDPPGSDPFDGGPSPLLAQTEGFAKVAHEAREECQRQGDAQQQLERRRNRSAQ